MKTRHYQHFRFDVRFGGESLRLSGYEWDGHILVLSRAIEKGGKSLFHVLCNGAGSRLQVFLFSETGKPELGWDVSYQFFQNRGPVLFNAMTDAVALEQVGVCEAVLNTLASIDFPPPLR